MWGANNEKTMRIASFFRIFATCHNLDAGSDRDARSEYEHSEYRANVRRDRILPSIVKYTSEDCHSRKDLVGARLNEQRTRLFK